MATSTPARRRTAAATSDQTNVAACPRCVTSYGVIPQTYTRAGPTTGSGRPDRRSTAPGMTMPPSCRARRPPGRRGIPQYPGGYPYPRIRRGPGLCRRGHPARGGVPGAGPGRVQNHREWAATVHDRRRGGRGPDPGPGADGEAVPVAGIGPGRSGLPSLRDHRSMDTLGGIGDRLEVPTMRRLLVLGAGTAGTMVVNRLRPRLDPTEWQISVVEASDRHYYQPGYLFLPFGAPASHHLVKPTRRFIPPGVELVRGEVDRVAPDDNEVRLTDGRRLPYDYLVIATGVQPRPDQTPGMLDGGQWR